MKRVLFFIVVIFCFIIETNAQIIRIPSDFSTIQAGINSAATGDTVLVAEGTHFENINFKGKAITVASQFIMDGDTSHISKTIINGSQSTKPDTASVVTMWSGEDTTSVLMGFTITGGRGTIARDIGYGSAESYMSGGGVIINHSGGKIVHNIIEGNHLADPGNKTRGAIGCGILASVNHNHTAIIRANIIRNNTSIDDASWGGGVSLFGGRMLVENNAILGNTLNGQGYAGGPGIFHENEYYIGTIEDVIIRNNLIMGNKAYSENNVGFGGGIGVSFGFGSYDKLQIYNNVIAENFAEGVGGGVYSCCSKSRLFNNTLINNEAAVQGNSIHCEVGSKVFMYNNIVWSDVGNAISEILGGGTSISAYYNMLEEPIKPGGVVTESQNYYIRPIFKPNSYELAENSPGIGWGIDSIQFENAWYYAPSTDIAGNPRPDPIDLNIELGAYESPFENTLFLWVKSKAPFHTTDVVFAKINKDGIIYIVPEGTSIVVDSINKYKVESVDTLANAEVHIPLTDFSLGQYMVVAVSNTGFVSPYPFHFWVGDTTLPVLKVVEGTVRIGDSISVTSSKDGTVYLFKNPLQPDLSKIRDSNNFVDSLTVAADSLGKFPTTGLYDNYTYYLYAVDIYGQFSERGTVSIITGVEETADAVIHIYPNPVQDVLHINLSGKTGELQVFDISGKCLLQEQITGNENSVDVSCLEIGLYIVRLKYEKQIFTRKIVKY